MLMYSKPGQMVVNIFLHEEDLIPILEIKETDISLTNGYRQQGVRA